MEELGADAVVHPDPAADVLHVGADLLAQVGHLVDEGDLGREEGIGGVLDQLRAAAAGEQDRRFVEEQRPIDLAHDLAAEFVLGADDDPVGPLEIADRRAFAQEFGVGDDAIPGAVQPLSAMIRSTSSPVPTGTVDLVTTTASLLERLADFLRHGIDEGEVGMAVAAPARACRPR